jgi:hypothetical protein
MPKILYYYILKADFQRARFYKSHIFKFHHFQIENRFRYKLALFHFFCEIIGKAHSEI